MAERDRDIEVDEMWTRKRINESNLPRRLRGATFDGFHPELEGAVNAAKLWVQKGGGLVLTGPVGVGKSWLSAAATREACRRRDVEWISVPTLMVIMRSHTARDRAGAEKVITAKGSIVLDDLDKVTPSEFGRGILLAAIENRVQSEAPIIVTTNLRISQIGEFLGEAIMSRLAGMDVQLMNGPDRRLG